MSNAVVKISDAALERNVDALGALNAELASLKKKADLIKDKLIASGYSEISGKKFKAVISLRSSVRMDAKAAKSFMSPSQIAAASKVSESISVSLFDL